MAIAITVPRLGWSMEEGTFAGWLKADGETVRAGEMLYTLEGDKAAQEVESFDAGVLRLLPDGPAPGDTVRVGQVLGHLVAGNEDEMPAAPPSSAPPVAAAANPAPLPTSAPTPKPRRGPTASPRARRRAAELGVDWSALVGSGTGGRVRERDVIAARPPRQGEGQGEGSDRTPLQVAAGLHPHTPLRLAIARRMVASHQGAAPVTLTTTVDASNLVNLRDQFRAAAGSLVPTFTDLLVGLAARVLHDHPLFNARWEERGVVVSDVVNVAFAVDTAAGLVAPVVRAADTLGPRELARAARSLAARARDGQITDGEMQGATFTVTNLGGFGIDAFTPILNPPQAAILGVGRVRKQALPVGRRLVARDAITLSLTFDHRVADGAPAARFLQAVGRAVENPAERFLG